MRLKLSIFFIEKLLELHGPLDLTLVLLDFGFEGVTGFSFDLGVFRGERHGLELGSEGVDF